MLFRSAYEWNTGATSSSITASDTTGLYILVATDVNGCQSSDSVLVINQDLSVASIVSPMSGCAFDGPVALSFYVKNTGISAISSSSSLVVSYREGVSSEVSGKVLLANSIAPGDSLLLQTSLFVTLSPTKTTSLSVSAALRYDVNRTNDSLRTTIIERGVPNVIFNVDTIESTRPDTLVLEPEIGRAHV